MNFKATTLTSRHKAIIGALIAVAIIIVISIAIYSRTSIANGRALEQAFAKLAAQDTLRAKANLTINLPERLGSRNRPFTKVDIAIEGDLQRTEDATPQFAGTLTGDITGRGNAFFVRGETRVFPDEVAFYLDEFPTLLNPSGSLSKRWTYVDASLLRTNNVDQVKAAGALLAQRAQKQGNATIDGVRTTHYAVSLTPEDEQQLVDAFAVRQSNNRALQILARLVRANNVASFDIYVNQRTREIAQLKIDFVRPLEENRTFDFATLTLAFTDYGREVAIDRPEQQLSVRPEVFAKLFGTGELTTIDTENNER